MARGAPKLVTRQQCSLARSLLHSCLHSYFHEIGPTAPASWLAFGARCPALGTEDAGHFLLFLLCTQPPGPELTCESGTFLQTQPKCVKEHRLGKQIVEEVPHTIDTAYNAHTGTCSTLSLIFHKILPCRSFSTDYGLGTNW